MASQTNNNITHQTLTLPVSTFDLVKKNTFKRLIIPDHITLESGFLSLHADGYADSQLIWVKDWTHTTIRGASLKLNLSIEDVIDNAATAKDTPLTPDSAVTVIDFLPPERTAHIFAQTKTVRQ